MSGIVDNPLPRPPPSHTKMDLASLMQSGNDRWLLWLNYHAIWSLASYIQEIARIALWVSEKHHLGTFTNPTVP